MRHVMILLSTSALAGALLVQNVPEARAAAGGSGTEEKTISGATTTEPSEGGTASGAGRLEDGAARAEAAEAKAVGGEKLAHPKSVQHQSTAQNPLCEQGPSDVPNPNVTGSPSENAPSSEPIGDCPKVAAAPPPPPPPPPAGEKIVTLRGPHFDFDKAALKPHGKALLDDVASLMNQNRDLSVRAEGHTDAMGSDAYNARLAERRSAAVRDYIATRGVDPNRIEVENFGESRPLAPNETEEGRARNRRVEIVAK